MRKSTAPKNKKHRRPAKRRTSAVAPPSRSDAAPAPNPPSAPDAPSAPPAHRWTFLTNHTHVLAVLDANPWLILREVARRVGITERAVQRIVQELEDEGFIRREKVGRQNHYEILTEKPLRHPIESHRKIGDLLKLIRQ